MVKYFINTFGSLEITAGIINAAVFSWTVYSAAQPHYSPNVLKIPCMQ
jgi:hypothetical protein